MEMLNEIINCSNIKACLENCDENHPCYKIIHSQKPKKSEDFHVPEPWSGNLQTAPILFISLASPFDTTEEYPTLSWSEYITGDFFINRFTGGLKPWVKNELYPLLKDGTHKKEWMRYWAGIRKRTSELLGKKDIKPGIDFAIYPIVHCKAQNEEGIKEAAKECMDRYLRRALKNSSARVIVCLGKDAEKLFKKAWNIPNRVNPYGPVILENVLRYVLYSHHPTDRHVSHSLKTIISAEDLRKIKAFLYEKT